jgi:NAD(P)-dependent dehydrogenase (short-subunit alcohol dehydrogenase family)
MKDVRNKVAVITGAASGIGLAMAQRFVRAGMKVVLSDVEVEPLAAAMAQLRAAGGDVHQVITDVAKPEQVQALARESLSKYGAVHVLCNNAGIFEGGGIPSWQTSLDDWNWILGVNLMGVIHGLRTFLPIMHEQGSDAHIVNTASIGGFIAGNPLYSVTKFGVVALSEALYAELQRAGSKTQVSLLCPGYVKTRLADSLRNRPADLPQASPQNAATENLRQRFAEAVDAGIEPDVVAEHVLSAILEQRFYVFTHPESLVAIERKTRMILSGENPTVQPPPRPRTQA